MVVKRIALGAGALLGVVWACSSGPSGPAGGPVSGALDTHCSLPDGGTTATAVDPASCQLVVDGGTAADYGATVYNAEADDDDCKYHVKFTSTPIYENTDVSFTVVATKKADGLPATGLAPKGSLPDMYIESFINNHPSPNSPTTTVESPKGTYKIGPVRFDQPGRWTVRFHLFGNCEDAENSPHGHVAFFIDVP